MDKNIQELGDEFLRIKFLYEQIEGLKKGNNKYNLPKEVIEILSREKDKMSIDLLRKIYE